MNGNILVMVLDLIQKENLHIQMGESDKNFIIFGADLSNSKHATNKTQSVLLLGHDLRQKINDTTI